MSEYRDALDRALAQVGTTVTLQRVSRAAPPGSGAMTVDQSVAVLAFMRALSGGDRADQLVGSVAQNDWLIILSPTGLEAAGWNSGSTANQIVPMRGNRVQTPFGVMTVTAATPFYVAEELVRIELQARG